MRYVCHLFIVMCVTFFIKAKKREQKQGICISFDYLIILNDQLNNILIIKQLIHLFLGVSLSYVCHFVMCVTTVQQ